MPNSEWPNKYATFDTTVWLLVRANAALTVSGGNEIIASFERKTDAEWFARENFGPRWRRDYAVGRRQRAALDLAMVVAACTCWPEAALRANPQAAVQPAIHNTNCPVWRN